MSKHTAGPWKAHKTVLARSGVPEYQIHYSDIGECVAEVVHGEANAKLISAAPELLEALNKMVGMIDFGNENPQIVLDQARAAIAKATGGES